MELGGSFPRGSYHDITHPVPVKPSDAVLEAGIYFFIHDDIRVIADNPFHSTEKLLGTM